MRIKARSKIIWNRTFRRQGFRN